MKLRGRKFKKWLWTFIFMTKLLWLFKFVLANFGSRIYGKWQAVDGNTLAGVKWLLFFSVRINIHLMESIFEMGKTKKRFHLISCKSFFWEIRRNWNKWWKTQDTKRISICIFLVNKKVCFEWEFRVNRFQDCKSSIQKYFFLQHPSLGGINISFLPIFKGQGDVDLFGSSASILENTWYTCMLSILLLHKTDSNNPFHCYRSRVATLNKASEATPKSFFSSKFNRWQCW